MSSTQETQSTQNDDLKVAREELRAARDEVHSLAAILNEHDELTDEESRRYQARLKGLGKCERSDDPEYVRRGVDLYDRMRATFEERIADRVGEDALPTATAEAADGGSSEEPTDSGSEEQDTPDEATRSNGNGRAAGARQILFLGNGGGGGKGLDELSSEQYELITKKQDVVFYMLKDGLSACEAVEEVDIDRSARWARDLRAKYQEEGFTALLDNRWFRTHAPTVMTSEVRKRVMLEMSDRRAAGPTAIWTNVVEWCRKQGIEPPSCSSVKAFMASLTPLEVAVIHDDEEGFRRNLRPVTRFEMADYANDRFQMDHTQLDIWLRKKVDGEWVAVRAWLTAVLDVYSRSVAGFFLSTSHPDAMSISLAVHDAVMPKDVEGWPNRGLPDTVQHDQGADFMSEAVISWFMSLGVFVDPAPPNYPEADGKIERFFQTLDRGLLRRLPGHKEAVGRSEGAAEKRVSELLTRNQLKERITRWVAQVYHQTVHSTTDEKPAERWERTVHLREPENDEVYRTLLLRQDKTRVVQNDGITLTLDGTKRRYWCPDLAWNVKREIRLAYHPEMPEAVAVYGAATGEFIGRAFDLNAEDSPYGIEDMKRVRGQMVSGLNARLEQYREDVAENDRKKAGGEGEGDPGPEGPSSSPGGGQSQGSDEGDPDAGKAAHQDPSNPSPAPAQGQNGDEDLDELIEKLKASDREAR